MRDVRNRVLIFSVLVLAMVALPVPAAWAESRIALVIGNDAYRVDPLSNPVNDAELMARTLGRLGFEVELKINVGEKQMRRLIEDFGQRLKRPGAVGVFYYSGHGMQVNGRNYMIPVDADIKREVDVRSDGVAANDVLWWMSESRSDRNIVILDACRDNPFEKSFKSGRKGLARMDAPTGTLIAYAAAPGAVADQGPRGGHSPYTEVLAQEMVVAGVPALNMFDRVSRKVIRRTRGGQRPFFEVSALGEFYFSGGRVSQSPVAPRRAEPAVGVYPKTYGVGETFRDCDVCPEMVVVPAGSFVMGSPVDEEGGADDEGPQHRVTIPKPFAVGMNEVTRREYGAFVTATGRGSGDGCYYWDQEWKKDASKNWRSPGYEQRDDHPVVCVSWNDARAYVKWLSEKTGKQYRLMTEAEWEYVARAETSTVRYWGDDGNLDRACGYANVADQSAAERYGWSQAKTRTFQCRDGYAATAPVGTFNGNAFGARDVLGNVWEWVADCYEYDAYNTHGRYPAMVGNFGDSCRRVLRGGSWGDDPRYVRSAIRVWDDAGDRGSYLGFRVARTF